MDVDADGSDLTHAHWHRIADQFQTGHQLSLAKDTSAPSLSRPDGSKLRHAGMSSAQRHPERKRELRDAIAQLRAEVGTLKKFSF